MICLNSHIIPSSKDQISCRMEVNLHGTASFFRIHLFSFFDSLSMTELPLSTKKKKTPTELPLEMSPKFFIAFLIVVTFVLLDFSMHAKPKKGWSLGVSRLHFVEHLQFCKFLFIWFSFGCSFLTHPKFGWPVGLDFLSSFHIPSWVLPNSP